MHIPDGMLNGTICPVTALVGTVGLLSAAVFATKQKEKPSSARFGAITSVIFAAQMMNFPILLGTSGHLLGGVAASALMGTPFGILSIALVVMIQGLIFADGGLMVLGANVVNMALIGAGGGGLLLSVLRKKCQLNNVMAIAVASVISVVLASLFVCGELAWSGQGASGMTVSMVLIHALIGLGEAAITVGCYTLFAERSSAHSTRWNVAFPLLTATVIAMLFSPFASGYPDGLEWVAQRYSLLHESAPMFVSPLADYMVAGLSHEVVATGFAGLTGVFVTFLVASVVMRLLSLKKVAR
ncbi:MAG: cobalamin biosynthesis protein CbiM [Spartobacteria bacterium]|nr:cobalamin biosynthesis protein CbiM [Spartobacteria bacterium]